MRFSNEGHYLRMNINYPQEGTQGFISMLQADITTAELQSREVRRKLLTIEHLLYADTVLGTFAQIILHTLKQAKQRPKTRKGRGAMCDVDALGSSGY